MSERAVTSGLGGRGGGVNARGGGNTRGGVAVRGGAVPGGAVSGVAVRGGGAGSRGGGAGSRGGRTVSGAGVEVPNDERGRTAGNILHHTQIGYHGLKENASHIDAVIASPPESIPGKLRKKIFIFPAEYFWALLSFVDVCDMVRNVISIL